MKKLKLLTLSLALIIIISAVASCADTSTAGDETDSVTKVTTDAATDKATEGAPTETDKETDGADETPKRSPIAYFSFDEVDENGGFIEDISGESCVSVGSPAQLKAGAKSKKALYLDGKSYLTFDTELPLGNSDHSVSAWIKINKAMPTTSDGVVAGWGEYKTKSDTRLLIYRNNFCASSYGSLTSYPISDNYKAEWIHLTMTFEDNSYRMYLNGTLIGYAASPNTNILDTVLYIGGFGNAGLNFMGAIDELCIYDVALTPAEVVEVMNGNIDYVDPTNNEMKLFGDEETVLTAGWNNMMYNGKTYSLTFKLYLPQNYDPAKKYPTIVFMSGDGGINDPIDEVIGGNEAVYLNRCIIEGEDCIAIVPFMPSRWLTVPNDSGTVYPYKDYSMSDATPSYAFNEMRNLLSECIDTLAVDENRVYYIGYSRGAMAGFYWLANDPKLFAGAILCAGATDVNAAEKYKDVPVWMFIGSADTLVDVARFKSVYDAYEAAGGNGQFTSFTGGDHSLKAYMIAQQGVVEWLFSKTKA